MEFNDKETRKILEKEIEKISEEYNDLKSQQEYLKSRLNSLESEAQFALNKNDRYYYESEKQTPRAPFN
jgi:chaperonin cofactor prefoldin